MQCFLDQVPDPISLGLLILFFFLGFYVLLVGVTTVKVRLHRLKSDQDEIWHDCSPIDTVSDFGHDVIYSQDGGHNVI